MKVSKAENTLEEAKERVTKLMKKNKEGKYDFDGELQRAKKEIWQKEQEAYEENAKRQQDILSYVELYNIKRGIHTISNNLSTTP